jgi:hypothetical protein
MTAVLIGQCRVSPADTSDSEFTIISPEIDSLTLVSPNGREILTAGSDHNITWTSTGTVGNIKIEYSIDGGESWTMIEDSTENDGGFAWTVPDTLSDHCLVRISENDEDMEHLLTPVTRNFLLYHPDQHLLF